MLKPLAGALVAAALAAMPAAAQDEAAAGQENRVAATVNGDEITASDIAIAVSALAPALEQVPPAQRPQMVLELLIDINVLADAAETAGLADDPFFDARMDFYRKQVLRDLYMAKILGPKIADEDVKARYEEEIAKLPKGKEVSARHILVDDEEKAKALIEELKGGADFASLAKDNSLDPGSAQNGGSLGFFGPGQMVPAFEEAAMALEPGSFTETPVKSRFGYHVIQVDDVREQKVPTLQEVGDNIRQHMVREAYRAELDRLKAEATIENLTLEQQ